MATFAELVSDVYTLTNRPYLVEETKLAVKMATLKAHQSDFYPKDLFEVGLSWTEPAFIQSIEYRTLIPRWRAFKYLRKYAGSSLGEFFKLLTPEETLDGYGINRENICYLAGEMLEIRSNTQDTNMIIGCYLNPITTEQGFTSWIALDHPYAIVFEAARIIFRQVGAVDEANNMRTEVAEQYMILKQEVSAYGE